MRLASITTEELRSRHSNPELSLQSFLAAGGAKAPTPILCLEPFLLFVQEGTGQRRGCSFLER